MKKVKALDPHMRYPEVGYKEAEKFKYFRHEMRTIFKIKCQGFPSPGSLPTTTRILALAKVFLVSLPEIDENRAFLAND